MSDNNINPVNSQEELLRRLKSIGADLWGSVAGNSGNDSAGMSADIEEAWRQEMGRNASPARIKAMGTTGQSGHSDAPETVQTSGKLTLDNLWMTADETVDWTDALLWDTPRDGLTCQKLWNFYHRMADKVLAGDTSAYAEVLTTLNPLGDLTEYVTGMILRTPGSDRVECVFECQREDLEQHGRNYLGALSLRIARDLLAVLPVTEVEVIGNLMGEEKIHVTFRREQLLKKKMAFLQPADFVEGCGGIIREDG